MTVTEDIQAALVADVTLSALVSSAPAVADDPRIFLPGDLQDILRPYIVHFPVSVLPMLLYAGIANELQYGYQVSIFSDTFASGEAVLTAAANVLKYKLSTTINVFWQPGSIYLGYESETGVHHFVLDLTVIKLT